MGGRTFRNCRWRNWGEIEVASAQRREGRRGHGRWRRGRYFMRFCYNGCERLELTTIKTCALGPWSLRFFFGSARPSLRSEFQKRVR